jgi:hypothetical protein
LTSKILTATHPIFTLNSKHQAENGKTQVRITVITFNNKAYMKWTAESKELTPRHFQIKHDVAAGYYLYVFEGGKCIRDHLQDTFEMAVDVAFEDYGVPKNIWRLHQ